MEAVEDRDRTASTACSVLLSTPAYRLAPRRPVPPQVLAGVDDGDDALRRSTRQPRPARQSSRPATSDSPLGCRARDARDASRGLALFRSDFQRLFLQAPTVASFNLSCGLLFDIQQNCRILQAGIRRSQCLYRATLYRRDVRHRTRLHRAATRALEFVGRLIHLIISAHNSPIRTYPPYHYASERHSVT